MKDASKIILNVSLVFLFCPIAVFAQVAKTNAKRNILIQLTVKQPDEAATLVIYTLNAQYCQK